MTNNINIQDEVVYGYKVFRPDWTCSPDDKNIKQYTCPGKFEEKGELKICKNGMHFCENINDCFKYYDFNSKNKVAEVIAYGQVVKDGDKCCTNKLEIVREVSWDEVLRIVNTGENCTGYNNTGNNNSGNYNTGNNNTGYNNTGNNNTGYYNTGNNNSGDYNTGSHNTGYNNTGSHNTGYNNTGSHNTGDHNTGDYNTGDYNAGQHNSGHCNTGNYNTGNCNVGQCNAGNWNAGDHNTGNWNTGNNNIGDWNTGDWNLSSFNNGCFMTEESRIMMFNKLSNWTYREWLNSEARCLLDQISANAIKWIYTESMTEEEKAEHPTYKTVGGYLKVLDKSEYNQFWWDSLSEYEKNIIKAIPNFDADIFKEITGIKVDE